MLTVVGDMDDELSPSASARRGLARQACDRCRTRKAKCEPPPWETNLSPESSSTCWRCARLKIPCTFLFPIKVRGPKKRHKTNEKNLSSSGTTLSLPEIVERSASHSSSGSQCQPDSQGEQIRAPIRSGWQDGKSIISPTNSSDWSIPIDPNLQTTPFNPPESRISQQYPTDGLCQRDLLKRILADYLKFVYPLIPVVHRPSFLQDLSRNRDVEDKEFLGLLVALAMLVNALMPSKFQEYRSFSPALRFKTRKEMMKYCSEFLSSLRGLSYFDELNHQKWAISYCQTVSFFQVGERNQSRMVDVEAMQLARLLNLHQISEYEGLNCIETQLRKKGFWLQFYSHVHAQLASLRREKLTFLDPLILSSINLEDLIPFDVEDEMIFEDRIVSQSSPSRSLLTNAFITHSRVFWAALANPNSPTSKVADICECVLTRDPALHIKHLRGRINRMKYMLDDIPLELRQWAPLNETPDSNDDSSEEQKLAKIQLACLRSNLHVTHLWLQSILLDQLEVLQHGQTVVNEFESPYDPKTIWADREDISRQLLHLLHNIPQVSLEPNGLFLAYKVRDVAVALLTCPYGPDEPASKRAAEYVREFTSILSHLDASETVNTNNLQSWIDVDRIRGAQRMTDCASYHVWHPV